MERPPIDVEALHRALDDRWARIVVVDEDESTNTSLLQDVSPPDRAVLVAEHQTSGRGRLARTWSSPPRAGLTFSVVVRPDVPIRTWGWLPLLTGVAVREALAETTGCELALKWPNDVLHAPSERKLAGILAQTSGEAVVIGIGLNVTTTEDELPVRPRPRCPCAAPPNSIARPADRVLAGSTPGWGSGPMLPATPRRAASRPTTGRLRDPRTRGRR